jgi:multiple sugar transport system permease protein
VARTPSVTSRTPWRLTRRGRRALTGLALASPWLTGFLLLKLAPIVAALGFSFTNFYMLEPDKTRFVGLANYARLLGDQSAMGSFFATAALPIQAIPAQLIVALALAVLLNHERLRNKMWLRTLYFLPSIIPATAILFMWQGFLDPNAGWLNRLLLQPLGLAPYPGPFTEAGFNLLQMMLGLWSIGPGMLIMLGAMQGVPRELYEAARVDGAGPIMRFASITLPMISPAILFSLVINLISVFGGVAMLDRGNPFSGSASPFDGYIYTIMFRHFELGYASSLAWVFFVVMLVVTLLIFRWARSWVFYADGEAS